MTKLATITAFVVVLVLGGCQYDGTTDLSNLLKPGERIVITKEKIDEDVPDSEPEPETEAESHYYFITFRGPVPLDDLDEYDYTYASWGRYHSYGNLYRNNVLKYLGPDISILADIYDRVPDIVRVDGNLGLFIEYNYNNSGEKFEISSLDNEFYMVTGGNTKYLDYSSLPSGVLSYSGKVVARDLTSDFTSDATSGFRTGTVNSEVNFDKNSVSIEFSDTGIINFDNLKIENMSYDPNANWMNSSGYYENDTGRHVDEQTAIAPCRSEQCIDYSHYSVGGIFLGPTHSILDGSIELKSTKDPNETDQADLRDLDISSIGVFVAERDDAPVQ